MADTARPANAPITPDLERHTDTQGVEEDIRDQSMRVDQQEEHVNPNTQMGTRSPGLTPNEQDQGTIKPNTEQLDAQEASSLGEDAARATNEENSTQAVDGSAVAHERSTDNNESSPAQVQSQQRDATDAAPAAAPQTHIGTPGDIPTDQAAAQATTQAPAEPAVGFPAGDDAQTSEVDNAAEPGGFQVAFRER